MSTFGTGTFGTATFGGTATVTPTRYVLTPGTRKPTTTLEAK
jgi:hypothetical protein